MTDDLRAIEAVAWTYLDGLYEGDNDKIARAFHDCSHLYSVGADGKVVDWPRAQWFEIMAARPAGKARGLKRNDRIVSIDLAGPEMAIVKLECSLHPRYFTDYLTMLKLKDGWRVVSKTFRTDIRE
jgi:hypothetical protein